MRPYGWTLILYDWCLRRKERNSRDACTKNWSVKIQSVCKPRIESLGETYATNTLILDFQPAKV
jgi:hypothetical protein